MRLCFSALVLFAGLSGCSTQPSALATYQNPVLYADYSDPDVIRVGTSYYLVASSFHFSPGLPVLKSEDLVHWQIISHVVPKLTFDPLYNMPGPFELDDTKSKPVTGTRYAGGIWAPAIRYHDGKYFVYWPTPDEGIFMATALKPEGPWSAPVAVIAAAGLEDPCPFWDADGQAWLIHGKVGAGPLVLHKLSRDGTRVLDDGVIIANDKDKLPVLEGPKLYQRRGWYYIFAPIGGVDKGSQAVGRARSIYGPYDWRVVLEQGTTAVQGPHQGAYVETPDGAGWFMHFNSTGAFGRIDYLEPVHWVDDWPVIGEPIAGKLSGQPANTAALPTTVSTSQYRLQDSDEFESEKLGLQWSWNHNPDDSKWSLAQRPGFLRLIAASSQYLTTARNTLTQILQGPAMQATARVDVSHLSEGQRAGLSLFGVKPVWVGVVRENGISKFAYAAAGVETFGPAITEQFVYLRAEALSDQNSRFAFSVDGEHFTALGEPTALSKFSWWKGSRLALFTFSKGASGGYIDVDWIHVSH